MENTVKKRKKIKKNAVYRKKWVKIKGGKKSNLETFLEEEINNPPESFLGNNMLYSAVKSEYNRRENPRSHIMSRAISVKIHSEFKFQYKYPYKKYRSTEEKEKDSDLNNNYRRAV